MIGALRSRVGVYHAVETPDALGGTVTTWPLFKAVWTDIKLSSQDQSFQNGRAEVAIQYRVTLRFIDNFPERARLMWGDRILHVVAASDPDGRRERLHLICEEERQ